VCAFNFTPACCDVFSIRRVSLNRSSTFFQSVSLILDVALNSFTESEWHGWLVTCDFLLFSFNLFPKISSVRRFALIFLSNDVFVGDERIVHFDGWILFLLL